MNDSSLSPNFDSIIVDVTEISSILKCTKRYVYKLISENKALFDNSIIERNRYSLKLFLMAYISLLKNRNQKASISETNASNNINPNYQRARYNASMADKIELENYIKRNLLVDIDFVISQLLEIQNIYNSGLNGLKSLAIINDDDIRKRKQSISSEINRVRETTANEIEVLAKTLIGQLSSETTAESDSSGMGGEISDTTAGEC